MDMHIWKLTNWQCQYNLGDSNHQTGLRLRFDKNVHPEVKRAIGEFAKWLRQNYLFPIRVNIYVKSTDRIVAKDQEKVVGTFWGPDNKQTQPYIRIATGDYEELCVKKGVDKALTAMIVSLAHELTHYFQWVNDVKLTQRGEERQATCYSRYILWDYAETREHP